MAIAYSSSGAGVATETSGAALSPACPATVNAGDILILHTAWEGTTSAPSPPADWTLLGASPYDVGSAAVVARHWVYGKIADGTEDGAAIDLGSPAVTTQRAARIHSFSGRVAGSITQLVPSDSFSSLVGDTDPTGPTVTTTLAGALACALVYQNDNNTLETFSGSSDTWTERGTAGGYIFALAPGGVLDLLTATPAADPGTVSGGAMTVANDPWGVIGFQIIPSVSVTADLAVTEANETLSSDVDVLVQASSSTTEASDTLAATASAFVQASSSTTEASDTLAATASAFVQASSSTTEAAETLSSAGSVLVQAAASVTEGAETLSAAAAVLVVGTSSTNEDAETLSATGPGAIATADSSTTDASETLSAAGVVVVAGAHSKTEENETLSSAGSVAVVGESSVTEAAETLSGEGFHATDSEVALHGVVSGQPVSSVPEELDDGTVDAALSITEQNETLAADGSVLVAAVSASTEADDTVSATGAVSGGQDIIVVFPDAVLPRAPLPDIHARLRLTEDDETLVASAVVAESVIQRIRRHKIAVLTMR